MPAETPVELERVVARTDEVRALIDELNQELSQNYAPEQQHGLALDAIFRPHVRFFVARVEGSTVGCGGIALFPDFAEVKRMYVRSGWRSRGVAGAIAARLEAETLGAGLRVLRLETGIHQTAAIRFYRRRGFQPCEPFEPYSTMPPQHIAASVFLEKRLFDTTPVRRRR